MRFLLISTKVSSSSSTFLRLLLLVLFLPFLSTYRRCSFLFILHLSPLVLLVLFIGNSLVVVSSALFRSSFVFVFCVTVASGTGLESRGNNGLAQSALLQTQLSEQQQMGAVQRGEVLLRGSLPCSVVFIAFGSCSLHRSVGARPPEVRRWCSESTERPARLLDAQGRMVTLNDIGCLRHLVGVSAGRKKPSTAIPT